MSKEERFEEIYNKLYQENAEYMERMRTQAQGENKNNHFILAGLILATILINIIIYKLLATPYNQDSFQQFWGISVMIVAIIYFKIINRGGKSKIGEFKRDFKNILINGILKSFDENAEYNYRMGIPPNIYKVAEFESYDLYYTEDFMRGNINENCRFAMSEVWTQNESTDSDGNTTYSTIFRGLFSMVETPKDFKTTLYLRNDRKDKNFLSRAFSGKLPFDNLRIQLDSQEFEKVFDVYASDKIIAMQLLTSDIMQDLMNFYNDMGMNYEITIKNNTIFIRFWCGQMFESASLKKFSLDKEVLFKYYKMLDFTFTLSEKLIKIINETEYSEGE